MASVLQGKEANNCTGNYSVKRGSLKCLAWMHRDPVTQLDEQALGDYQLALPWEIVLEDWIVLLIEHKCTDCQKQGHLTLNHGSDLQIR